MFIVDTPAMKLGNLLIVADLHLGITKDIWDQGIKMPNQADRLSARLSSLKISTKTRKLVILGDIKHQIPNISWQEHHELPEFFSKLKFREVIILKGNHDGRIERLLPNNVKIKKSYAHKNYVFTHGHRHIKTSKKTIIIGHNQPHIKFVDQFGATYVEPAWVRGPLTGPYQEKNLIMVPAYNELAGATIINHDHLLGPIARCLSKKRAHCYLLDGTDLGVINDLQIID